jgi:hypothetical protein
MVLRRLRAWLRALPLQRRVAYLTTAAVALAVAVTSVAGYMTLRISLYQALDAEMVQTATSLAVSTRRGGHSDSRRADRACLAGGECQRGRDPDRRRDFLRSLTNVIIWCSGPRSSQPHGCKAATPRVLV